MARFILILTLFIFFPLRSFAEWTQQAEYIRAVHHSKIKTYWLSKDVCEHYVDTINADIGVFCFEIPGLVVDDPSETKKYEDEIYALWTIEDYWINNVTTKLSKTKRLPISSWSFGIPQMTVGTANDVLKIWRKKQRIHNWQNGTPTENNPIPTLLKRYPSYISGRDLLTDTDLSFAVGIWHYLSRRKAFLKSKYPLMTAVRCYNCGEGGLKKGLSFGYWSAFHAFLTYKHLWRKSFYVIPGKETVNGYDFKYFVSKLINHTGF